MLKLTPNEKTILKKKSTSNSEAFDNYLHGKNLLYKRTKDSVNNSVELFKKAVILDPNYADAYAALGIAYGTLYQEFESNESFLDDAINSSLKALIKDSSSADAYAALALAYFYKKLNEEAFAAGKKAIELDPNNFLGYWILGRIYGVADKDKEAIELFNKVIEINPDFYSVYSDMRMSYERLGEKEKMFELLETAYKVYSKHLTQNPDDGRAHMVYAIDLSITNKIEEAKIEAAKAIELNPTDPLMLYNAACFYSRIGEKEIALNTLTNAMNAGYHDYEWTKNDPDLENIRNEAEYIELMKGK